MIDDPVLRNDWHPLARSDSLGEGQVMGARLLGQDVVLWRVNGQVRSWQDLCIHRGTRLSLGRVEQEQLVCPYHGWSYNAAGQCTHIPAHPGQNPPTKAVVEVYQACEKYGLTWVSLGRPQHDVPPFPEWTNPGFRKIFCGPYEVNASGPRIIENFLDVGHFPLCMKGFWGLRNAPKSRITSSKLSRRGWYREGSRFTSPTLTARARAIRFLTPTGPTAR